MVLLPCSECGNEISDKATACPKCGVPIGRLPIKSRLFWAAAIVLGSLFVAAVGLYVLLELEPIISWISRMLSRLVQ